ncbi:MAG: hypothetical protein L3K04_00445 [Thermoplasmata archaeon]|nr:hypothetical protein [Thermoplasmata archaeon]MCI4337915.1 hypothetical protein [Thermoplasmata archaeon]MCI4340914.1 hypothetical protein [Thermoplasmata archaeon]
MSNFLELAVLSAAMGFSIYLSLPLLMSHSLKGSTRTVLTAVAIGILVFLMADVFSNVASLNVGSALFLTVPVYDLVFVLAAGGAFLMLLLSERHGDPAVTSSPYSLALVIALAIGFQNLTEGLVFGAAWAAGAVGLSTVVFVGFFFQNLTEGFPIASPFLGETDRRLGRLAGLFLVGGLPTLLGGIIGYFYNSALLDILFGSLAIGAILYAILPMLRVALRPAATPELSAARLRLTYLGILLGFLLGFGVNAF